MIDKTRFMTGADGTIVFVTMDGDMVDAIAFAYYGTHKSNTEQIYEMNPGLAKRGPVLAAGVIVKLPPIIPQTQPQPFRRLWD